MKTFEPLKFDVKNPESTMRSIWEEWAPHERMSEKTFEWWYITTIVHDAEGNPYFMFLSVSGFRGNNIQQGLLGEVLPLEKACIGLTATITDYNQNIVRVPMGITVMDMQDYYNSNENRITANDGKGASVDWDFVEDTMNLKFTSNDSDWDFKLSNCSDALWHKDKLGIEGFIQQGAEDDFSYYYSLPNVNLSGRLTLKNKDKSIDKVLDVHGRAWVDRQWGDFNTLFWEWASFRFNNGATMHLYNFFNGHQEGMYRDADGNVQYFEGVKISQNGYVQSDVTKTWTSWGWTYEFPIEIEGSKHYTVEPMNKKEFMEFPTLNVPYTGGVIEGYGLFEGAGKLVNDETGKIVGMSVNESGDSRVMQNLPFGVHQN